MKFKNLLGLVAIGGAVAYAQKRRGGEMSLAGFKNTFNEVLGNVKNQVSQLGNKQGLGGRSQGAGSQDVGASSRSGIADEYTSGGYAGGTSGTSGTSGGYTGGSSGTGGYSGGTGGIGGNGSNRKF